MIISFSPFQTAYSGSQLRKELTQCIAVGTELPQGDDIRAQLLVKKEAIETALDEFPGFWKIDHKQIPAVQESFLKWIRHAQHPTWYDWKNYVCSLPYILLPNTWNKMRLKDIADDGLDDFAQECSDLVSLLQHFFHTNVIMGLAEAHRCFEHEHLKKHILVEISISQTVPIINGRIQS